MLEIEKQRHITEEMWIALKEDTLDEEDFLKILEHTCECTYCAGRLAQSMESDEDESLMPPVYLKNEILERTGQINVQAAVKIKETSKKIQLMLYGLKVGVAVVASVFILVLTASVQNVGFSQIEPPRQQVQTEFPKKELSVTDRLSNAANSASDLLSDVSNFILNGGK